MSTNGKNNNNAAVMINLEYLDWIRRNPALFVNNLLTRLEVGQTDRFPNDARWNGDAMPGVQVVHVGSSDFPAVVVVGKNIGKKLGTVSAMEEKLEVIKELAHEHGCVVQKKTTRTPKPTIPGGGHVKPASVRQNKKKARKSRRR